MTSKPSQKIQVDAALTRKVAQLARLSLTDAEVLAFSGQLQKILTYVEKLQEVDVTGTEPLTRPLDLATPLREDELRPENQAEFQNILETAPDLVQNGFKVPSVL